jgi:hypothetical protein
VSEPTVVCILGMHRSGTSLVSRVLNVLGLDLGPKEHLIGPSADNPAGYWESKSIKEINDEILLRLGGSWFEPPELGAGWERSRELAELRRRARELIKADFSDSDTWGFKDPRNSLTLPFWQRIVGPMRYVICLRNPVDVAASLESRQGDAVPFEQGLELWLTYVHAALAATAGHRQQILFYEDLMANPEPAVGRLARFIGHRSDAAKPEAREAIRLAMSAGLWHHRTAVANVVDASRLAFHLKALYLALRQFVPGEESVGTEVLDLFAADAADTGRRLAQLEADRAALVEVREQRAADQAELTKVREDLVGARGQAEALVDERAALQRRLSERSAELEQVAASLADERRLRSELEAEVQAAREALAPKRQSAESDAVSGTEKPPTVRAAYARLAAEVRARVQELIPSGATVLVASKGDNALLRVDGRRGWHFPMATDGRYAGHHPAGDTAAIAHLEALRARGADHLVLPATMLWWLDHYRELRRHLEDRYEQVLEDEQCVIYRLSAGARLHANGPVASLKATVASLRTRSGRDPSILDWRTELGIAEHLPEMVVFVPPDEARTLPYLEGTVDIVVLNSADAGRIAEARRVASSAVIRVDPGSPDAAELEWLAGGAPGWGQDVAVTLIPNGDEAAWGASALAFGTTMGEGFTGELSAVGDATTLGRATDQVAPAGVQLRPIEVPTGASLAQRALAATEAAGRLRHIFVTAPAVPLPDWLPSILTLFSSGRDAGVIGTRILSSDGTLEEAGGVLASGGSRRRRGEGDHDPDRPEYCFVRRVDFCSPPLLATRRDLFERLDGFDERQATADDAVVDFSLRAGQAGAPVYYQPQARLVAIGDGER